MDLEKRDLLSKTSLPLPRVKSVSLGLLLFFFVCFLNYLICNQVITRNVPFRSDP